MSFVFGSGCWLSSVPVQQRQAACAAWQPCPLLEEIIEGLREQGFRKQVLTRGTRGLVVAGGVRRARHPTLRGRGGSRSPPWGAGLVWEEALRENGLAGRGEVYNGTVKKDRRKSGGGRFLFPRRAAFTGPRFVARGVGVRRGSSPG